MSKRRKFSTGFKRGAVEQASQLGASCAQLAWELGIRDHLLTRRKREDQSLGKTTFGSTGTRGKPHTSVRLWSSHRWVQRYSAFSPVSTIVISIIQSPSSNW